MNALYHAIWTMRDRPEREKRAWQQVFDYYVFGPAERAGEHLPEAARGVLGPDRRRPGAADPRHADQQTESMKPRAANRAATTEGSEKSK